MKFRSVRIRGALPKAVSGVGLAVLLAALVAPNLYRNYEKNRRYAEAKALFDEHCKTSGERFVRTVDNVEGVVWLRWREASPDSGFANQFKQYDPFGHDCGLDSCIIKLLRATSGEQLDPEGKLPYHKGYRFVESVDPRDGKAHRYTLRLYKPFDRDSKWLETLVRAELVRTDIDTFEARYAITWDDLSTRRDREHWIAGSSLSVIDLQTKEVVAERIGFMVDAEQGDQSAFRSPWLFATDTACPPFPRIGPASPRRVPTGRENEDFVFRVLHPN